MKRATTAIHKAGTVLGIVNIYLEVNVLRPTDHILSRAGKQVNGIMSPSTLIKVSVFISFVTLNLCLPVQMDTILLVRFFIVYPQRRMSWPRRPFKLVRIGN